MWPMEFTGAVFVATFVLLIKALRAAYFSTPPYASLPPTRERNPFLDRAKGIAIIAVITVHTLYFFYTKEPETFPGFVAIANNLFRFAIPWFLITTGIVLDPSALDKGNILSFYKKRLTAASIPYILATLLIGLFERQSPVAILSYLATGRASLPYYYILVLLQCYLLYPILLRLRREPWFLPGAFLVTILSAPLPPIWYIYGFPFVGVYLYFFCLGIAIRPRVLSENNLGKKDIAAWLLILAASLTAMALFPGYYYNTSLFYGVALFHLFFSLRKKLTRPALLFGILEGVGRVSFWIFLTHMFVVGWIYLLFPDSIGMPDMLRFIIILTSAIPASILSGYVVHRLYRCFAKYISY